MSTKTYILYIIEYSWSNVISFDLFICWKFCIYIHAKFYHEVNLTAFEEKRFLLCFLTMIRRSNSSSRKFAADFWNEATFKQKDWRNFASFQENLFSESPRTVVLKCLFSILFLHTTYFASLMVLFFYQMYVCTRVDIFLPWTKSENIWWKIFAKYHFAIQIFIQHWNCHSQLVCFFVKFNKDILRSWKYNDCIHSNKTINYIGNFHIQME